MKKQAFVRPNAVDLLAHEPATIPESFRRSAEHFPGRTAIRNPHACDHEPNEISYRELGALSTQVAAALAERDVRKGDRVAIQSSPRIRFAAALLGILKVGAWAVPLDPSLTPSETATILEKARPKVAFAEAKYAGRFEAAACRAINLDDEGCGVAFTDFIDTDSPAPAVDVSAEDVAVLAYTSGTTGSAKGVMLSHGNLMADTILSTYVMPFTERDVFLSIAPWHHALGLTSSLLVPFHHGAMMMFTRDYRAITSILATYGVSVFIGVPKLYHAMYERLCAQIDGTRLGRFVHRHLPRVAGYTVRRKLTGGRLRFFVSGSAPLESRVSQGFRRLGIGLLEGYGLTETSPIVCFCDPFTPKTGTVGPPLPSIEVRVVEPGPDGVSELCVRGPTVMRGYYEDPEATVRAIDPDGWFHTGDLAALDPDGEIYLKGRAKNVIVLENGKKVYPEEVEWEIARIPFVEEVLVCRGSDGGHEIVQALVYPNRDRLSAAGVVDTAQEVLWQAIRSCQNRLSPHKRIRSREHLILVDHPFPKTSMQDIKRHAVAPTR